MRFPLYFLGLCSMSMGLVIPGKLVASFDEDFVKNKMMPIASAAYTNTPDKCITKVFGSDAVISRQVTWKCDPFLNDQCSSISGYIPSQKAIFVGFRGTTNPTQIFWEIDDTLFTDKMSNPGGGMVASYFYNATMLMWNQGLKLDLQLLLQKYPTYDLWITGHSLGGAMAGILTTYLLKLFPDQVHPDKLKLVTYGEPRTGDKDYAVVLDQLPYAFRVTHRKDIVAQIPIQSMGYQHHRTEVWYNNDMSDGSKYMVCTLDEDKNCSDGVLSNSIDDHTHYYGREVHDWGTAGCT